MGWFQEQDQCLGSSFCLVGGGDLFRVDESKFEPSEGALGKSPSGRKKSIIWKHFNELPHEHAECKRCLRPIAVSNGATSGMIRHLRHAHDVDWRNDKDYKASSDSKSENVPKVRKTGGGGSVNKAAVWNYFDRLLDDKDTAVCKTCGSTIKVKNFCTTGLYRHLERLHDIIVPKKQEVKRQQMDNLDDYLNETDQSLL